MRTFNPYTRDEMKSLYMMLLNRGLDGRVFSWLSEELANQPGENNEGIREYPINTTTYLTRFPSYEDMLFMLPMADVPLYLYPKDKENMGDVTLSIIAKWRLELGK